MNENDGGSAFPFPTRTLVDPYDAGMTEKLRDANIGMSLRDWFAGESLKGAADSICDNLGDADMTFQQSAQHAERHAKAAYMLADAMLAERAK